MTEVRLFDYELPRSRIAQRPARPRDSARLLILRRQTGRMQHRRVSDLPEILKRGDLLIFNDTKVFPARLKVRKETGGKMEVFLLRDLGRGSWEVLLGGHGRREGLRFSIGRVRGSVWERTGRTWVVRFKASASALQNVIERYGETPTPPYIKKLARLSDYQTIYAKHTGSVAAPTAGLHFTPRLLKALQNRGVAFAFVTLHVGYGTFQPIAVSDVRKHKLHAEWASVSSRTIAKIAKAQRDKRRVIAVGTTSVRVLEGVVASRLRKPRAFEGWIKTYITPGHRFRVVDAMLTNFHLPKSSLLVLVSAFAGRTRILRAYHEAIRRKYRFYSFGDGMVIV